MPKDILLGHMLPELTVLILAFFVMALDLIFAGNKGKLLGWVTVLGLGVALGFAGSGFSDRAVIMGETLIIDGTTAFFRVLILMLGLLIALATVDSLSRKRYHGEFYSLFLFSLLGAMFLASSNEMITLYLSLELLALPAYALVAFRKEVRKANEGALKYMILGLIASAFVVYAMSLIYGLTGETNIASIVNALSIENPLLSLAVMMFIAGFAFKMAAVPFHFWAPDAYDGAEPQITAYLASISKIAAFAAAIRIFYGILPAVSGQWSLWFALLAAVTMIIGTLAALPQTNIKRLLAYSSIAHAGFVLLGLAIPTALAYQGMLFYLFVYGIGSAGSFILVSALSKKYELDTLDDYKGLAQRSPIMAMCFAILVLSLIGIPPLAGFWGKLYIFAAAIDSGLYYLAIIGAVTSIISLGYYVGILKTMFIDEPADNVYEKAALPLRAAVYIATLAMFLLIYHAPILDMAAEATKQLVFTRL